MKQAEKATLYLHNANGKATVARDAEALDIAAQDDASEGIRQGLEDARKGNFRPAKEFFDEFEAMHGIPR